MRRVVVAWLALLAVVDTGSQTFDGSRLSNDGQPFGQWAVHET